MKIYQVLGNLKSNLTSENYIQVPVCDECIEEVDGSEQLGEFVSNYNPSYGDSCHFCGKTVEQEKEEQS